MRGKPVPEERPLSTCAECGKTDTDIKHRVVTDFGQLSPEGAVIRPTVVVRRHLDCCVSVGCWHDAADPKHCANVLASVAGA